MAQATPPPSDNEVRWGRVGAGLNSLNREVHPYIQTELKSFFQKLPRINDKSSEFYGCLADSGGTVLRFDPENEATPQKGGRGVQLCFKALPHYEVQTNGSNRNIPILVKSEHEFSRIYLQEFYSKEKDCSINQLDPGAIFRILKGASCFSAEIKSQAEVVREVRNEWAHAVMDKWDDQLLKESFVKMEALANLLPNSSSLKRKLQDDQKGDSSLIEQLKRDAMKEIQRTKNETLQEIKDAGSNIIEADLLAKLQAQLEEIKVTLLEGNKQGLHFKICEGGRCPKNAVAANVSEELFVGRAQHQGSLIPGKINPPLPSLYVSYGGEEIKKTHYEVLVQEGKTDNLDWVEGREGSLPHAAIQTGHEANGDPLYVARAKVAGGHWAVGKLNPKHGMAHLPYGGKEHTERHYEVLCFKPVVDLDA